MTPRRLVSPATGRIHADSGRSLAGRPVTSCGLIADKGWNTRSQRPARPVDCNGCLRKEAVRTS